MIFSCVFLTPEFVAIVFEGLLRNTVDSWVPMNHTWLCFLWAMLQKYSTWKEDGTTPMYWFIMALLRHLSPQCNAHTTITCSKSRMKQQRTSTPFRTALRFAYPCNIILPSWTPHLASGNLVLAHDSRHPRGFFSTSGTICPSGGVRTSSGCDRKSVSAWSTVDGGAWEQPKTIPGSLEDHPN